MFRHLTPSRGLGPRGDTMRALLTTAASIVALAVTAPAQVNTAHATTFAQKPTDHAAIGVTATPDRRPADPRPPMLKRLAAPSNGASRRRS